MHYSKHKSYLKPAFIADQEPSLLASNNAKLSKPKSSKTTQMAVIPKDPPSIAFLKAPPSIATMKETPSVKPSKDPPPSQKESTPAPETSFPILKRAWLSHIEGTGDGVGYMTDYSTAALLFAPDYSVGHTLPMVDLRIHRFDNNTYATNLGIVGRYIPESFCELLGFNIYYDWRQGWLGQFHQISTGVEVLGKKWDFRANMYFPISARVHQKKCVFDHYTGGFFAIERKYEAVSYGYNAEVGYLAANTKKGFLFYVAAGPYYMSKRRCHDAVRGVRARIRPQYKDYFAVDLSGSYDPIFHAVFQAEIIVSIPLYQIGPNRNRVPCGITDRQVYQRVERFEVMPLGRCKCWHTNF